MLLALLAGAAHVFSPDHWMPATLVGWRKGWRLPRLFAFLGLALALHVVLGFLLYLIFLPLLLRLTAGQVWLTCMALIALGSVVRSLRLPLVRAVFARSASGIAALGDALLCLGPAEILVTVLFKARLLGTGYPLPLAAFLAGSLASAFVLSAAGRHRYNRPGFLPRALMLSDQRLAALPVGVCLVAGAALLFKIATF